MEYDAYHAHYKNLLKSQTTDFKCFCGIPHKQVRQYQLDTAQLLNIKLLMNKDLVADEYLHCTR